MLRKKRSYSRSETLLTLDPLSPISPLSPRPNTGLGRTKSTSKSTLKLKAEDDKANDVFWPVDFLPISCPNVRIVTWGCQTLVTHGKLLPAQNNIFTHAGDLLQDLVALRTRTKTTGRGIIFLAHSLGGVVIKEVCKAYLKRDKLTDTDAAPLRRH